MKIYREISEEQGGDGFQRNVQNLLKEEKDQEKGQGDTKLI